MLNDPLANTMSVLLNCAKIGKPECSIKPSSKLIKNILTIMKEHGYIGDFTEIDSGYGTILKINLLGKINKCGAIKPRFAVKKEDIEKYEKRYLPAKDMGIILLSTPKGLMTNEEIKKKGIGGRLLIYCY